MPTPFLSSTIALGLLVLVALLLVAIGMGDARRRKIGNLSVLLVLALYAPFAALQPAMAQPLYGIGVAIVVFLFTFFCFTRNWLGGGDAKLIPAVTLWVGPAGTLPFLLLMVFGGLVVSVVLLMVMNKNSDRSNDPQGNKTEWRRVQLPYGVAIAGAGILVMGLRYVPSLLATLQAG